MMVIINALCSLVLGWFGLHYINSMSHVTRWTVRIAWLAVVAGSFALAIGPCFGRHADGVVTLLHVGVALVVVSDRRGRNSC